MNEAERFQSGELLAASRLNDALDYSRGQYAQVPGTDFDVFGGSNANGRAQKRFERIMLVRAREDFEIRVTTCSMPDDIPAGRVDMPRIIPQVNAYEVPNSIRPDWAYDPVAGLSGGPTKREGDYFHVAFNEDSGRWEVLSAPSNPIVTAVVISCIGEGWHEVIITEWDGEPGSTSSSQSASVSDDDTCDLCDLIPEVSLSDISASDEAIPLSCESIDSVEVTRDFGIPTEETVYAHTTRLMPMLIGGMIKMQKRSAPVSSGSVSTSVSDDIITDRLYDVVDGVWPLVSLPFPVWECCRDPETGLTELRMTMCTKAIVEGYSCPSAENPCPEGSVSDA